MIIRLLLLSILLLAGGCAWVLLKDSRFCKRLTKRIFTDTADVDVDDVIEHQHETDRLRNTVESDLRDKLEHSRSTIDKLNRIKK
jgi:hypothetical protein